MAVGGTKVVQVTNIAPQATKDQMQTLFGYLGKIEDIRLYPTIRDVSCPVQSRICYIKFMDSVTVGIAQHMTNTVFIDRALIVIPVPSGDIPDEYYALEMTRNGSIVPGLCPSEPKLPPNVVNSISGTGSDQVIVTTDPQLDNNGLTPYPPLPANYDSCKIEEIRRTILAGNLESSATTNEITEFFTAAGEVKYLRPCTVNGTNYYLIEFSEQPNVLEALKMDGKMFKNKAVSVAHSTQAITKPQAKTNEAAQREIEEAMSRVKEAQSLISAAIDPVIGMLSKDKRNSRRSRSRSRGRRRRSRSRSHSRRSRSRDRRRRSRSRSRDRRRRSRSKKRSHSRSRRSRSRRSPSRRSRSKSPKIRKDKRKSRERSREKTPDKRSRDKDRSIERTARRDDTTRSKEKERSRDKDRSRERERDKERNRDSRGNSKDKRRSREKESKEKRSDKESSVDREDKVERRRSRSVSRNKFRSRSRDRKNSRSRDKKRSRSRDRRKRTLSRERRRRSRSKSRGRKRDKRDRKDKNRSRSRSKVPRNYDEEEKGFDSEREKSTQENDGVDKESSEKSDNMDISNSP